MTTWGISGHIDLGSETRRLVAAELMVQLSVATVDGDELVGVTSLAGGADQVFAWVVTALGGRLEFVRPCEQYEETATGADLLGMQVGAQLADVTVQLPFAKPTEEAFMAAGLVVADRCDTLVVIWDGLPARGLGGTGDVVAHARAQGKPVIVVWPDGARRGEAGQRDR